MDILLATEIWGSTPHVDALADRLRPHARHLAVADPYDGRDPRFPDEKTAYAAYLDHGGLEPYARRVLSLVNTADHPTLLIGFSAGAATAWAAACTPDTPLLHACCFYGSAIRTMTHLTPHVPVDLIFPNAEPHFDVAALADTLADTLAANPLVTCHHADAGHGFMNPLSADHHQPARRHWIDWLVRLAMDLGAGRA